MYLPIPGMIITDGSSSVYCSLFELLPMEWIKSVMYAIQRTKLSRNYVVELDDGSNNDIKTSMYHFKLHLLKKII